MSSGTNPADRAAEMKARRADPTEPMQSIAASILSKALRRASSATGHFLRNQ